MCTPKSSEPGQQFLPTRRYLFGVVLAFMVFVALAMLEERQTFLSLIGRDDAFASTSGGGHPGLGGSAPAEASALDRPLDAGAGASAAARVRAFNAALEESYRARALTPLETSGLASTGLLHEVRVELEFCRARGAPAPALRELEIARVAPTLSGWSVWTRESWGRAGASAQPLRFRYTLAAQADGALRVEAMVADPPDPTRATPH